ncbi:MAG: hypothetical protein IMZ57_11075 [Acidobacteria bacterium]|nr:hypothetical protein [Acidobacteriota bacterium]
MSEEKKQDELDAIARRIRAVFDEFSEALKRAADQIGEAVAPLGELLIALEKIDAGREVLEAPLVLLGEYPSFNKWKGRHWGGYSKRKNKMENDIANLALLQGIGPIVPIPPKTRARVEIFVYQKTRRLDEDNLAGQVKPVFDSLRGLGLIYQDSPKWIRRVLDQGIDRDNPRIEIRSIKWLLTLARKNGMLRKEVKK